MIEIILLRHGKVNSDPALYGHTDVEVNSIENELLLEKLLQQHQQIPFEGVFSSPLKRCNMLAQQFCRQHDIALRTIDDFSEMNFGDIDGKSFEWLYKNNEKEGLWSKVEDFFDCPAVNTLPNAESLEKFNQRIVNCWQDMIDLCYQLPSTSTANNKTRILLVTHGGVIRIILAHILKLDWQNPAWYQNLKIGHGSMSNISIVKSADEPPYYHVQISTIGAF
jgi:alpha-ribazole phosphatase/probable phosphoglycerate mutase